MTRDKRLPGFPDTRRLLNPALGIISRIILVFLRNVPFAATIKLFTGLKPLLQAKTTTGPCKALPADIFTPYILIESARTPAEYFHARRLRFYGRRGTCFHFA